MFKGLGLLLVMLTLVVVLVLGGMRFHDGPIAILAGGPFKTGELASRPLDWGFLKGRSEIEFQTLSPATSRVVWLAVLDGRLFIASAYMNTHYGKVWKHWPGYLQASDGIILRVDGKLYEQRAQRLMALPELPQVMGIYEEKYGLTLPTGNSPEALNAALQRGDFWLFEVLDR